MDLMSLLGPLLGGLMGGLFGGPSTPQLTPQQQATFNYDQGASNRQYQYSRSAPGSSPGEMNALAQARGILGGQAYGQQQQAFAQSSPYSQNGLGNMLTNLKGQQTAGMSSLLSNFYNQAVQSRQQASFAPFVGGYPPQGYVQPTPNLAGIFGNLAQSMAYNRGLNSPTGGGAALAPYGGGAVDYGSMYGVGDTAALGDAMAGELSNYNGNF